ncbi:hypothetical protein [Parabacteroides distasonis]|uniref:hypothetical protein n=1 Tax=Parabacteroides distasonis TaxID=823 RepID=UPI002162BADD|nr:hypothetical protein [Parabacteroides distasonis]UVR77753.1 hypothetical protein NXV66_19250 [Parabacteroides distasonis]UVS65031.1 hypothetical protein NXX37_20130 [Parabacteroides distasonis]
MKSIIYYFSMISIFFFLSCTGWKDKKNMESDIITVNLDERDEISTKDLFSEDPTHSVRDNARIADP